MSAHHMTLLEHARSGDLAGLTERLAHTVSKIDRPGGGASSVVDRLLIEAYDCARRGDLDEATYRLRLRAEPKWASEVACRDAYNKAMQERARASA